MRVLTLILGFALCSQRAPAQEVFRVAWPTSHASPPVVLPKPTSDYLPVFRAGLAILPESEIAKMALSQPSLLGITAEDAANLQSLFAERYQVIQNDPVFREVTSALPYCYSQETPTQGLALIYRPKELNTNTPCIVFLHGYGGSFLWSQQLLAENFPNHLIICPVYGISSAPMPPSYLYECLDAVEKKLGVKIDHPTLIGLSAGGFGSVRIYTYAPGRFNRLVVLAAYPPEDTWNRFGKTMSVYFLAGAKEPYVQSGYFGRSMSVIRTHAGRVDFRAIPDADHFFLLSQKQETFKILHSWLEIPAPPKDKIEP
jgi:pimeloyl-ACP methyl ester carboxylesterase